MSEKRRREREAKKGGLRGPLVPSEEEKEKAQCDLLLPRSRRVYQSPSFSKDDEEKGPLPFLLLQTRDVLRRDGGHGF